MGNPKFYLDASAIVKRYWKEEGTQFINNLYEYEISKGSRMFTAKHSLAELSSTAYRLHREGRLSHQESALIIFEFLRECQSAIRFIETDDSLYIHSIISLSEYPLRAGDAMHLAAALDLHDRYGQDFYFVSDDSRQCDAALAEGIKVLRPRESQALNELFSL